MPALEELSRDELIALVGEQAEWIAEQAELVTEQAERIARQDGQITAMAGRLARLEYLLSRNSKNSSSPPSKDDDLGKTPPSETGRGGGRPTRSRGKQRGASGSNLAWTENPDDRIDRFPQGRCECGDDLGSAADLGIVDRYQQHEIPPVRVRVTQYDQHAVRCGCAKVHTASRPEGARPGIVGYGPSLAAFAVYLMVVHFVPAQRCVALLESLTGAAPSVGFVHGLLARTAGLLDVAHQRTPHQRETHPRPIHHPRLRLHRRQTRPQHHDYPARHDPRTALDTTTTTRPHLIRTQPSTPPEATSPLITPRHHTTHQRIPGECLPCSLYLNDPPEPLLLLVTTNGRHF